MNDFDLEHCCYNNLYPLYVKKSKRGLCINRSADGARIATILIRDLNQLVLFQWDEVTGKLITLFYRDGTARVYDVFQAGKLMALLRISDKKIDGGIWDRIEELDTRTMPRFDHDMTKSMPSMIKFARDSKDIYIVPYESPNRSWRLTTEEEDGSQREKRILDVHFVHQEDDYLALLFDGDYMLEVPVRDNEVSSYAQPSPLRNIVRAGHGLYHCFYQDGSSNELDIRPLIRSESTINLLKLNVVMKQLNRYLQDHLDLVKKDLVEPYIDFLANICCKEFGYELLHDELESALLTGSVTPQLEDWLCNTVGEKNFKRWTKLGLQMYQKSIQVLTLSFIPACERLIIMSERFRGTLKGLQLEEEDGFTSSTNLIDLISVVQDLLRLTLDTIKSISSQEVLFKTFLKWFDDRIHESLDEDYKPKLKLDDNCKTGYEIASYIEFQLNPERQASYVNDNFKIDSIHETLDKISYNLTLVNREDIEPRIAHSVLTGERRRIFYMAEEGKELLAVAPFPNDPYIVYFLRTVEKGFPKCFIGVLDKFTLVKRSKDYLITLPVRFERHNVKKVIINGFSNNQKVPSKVRGSHNHEMENENTTIFFKLSFEPNLNNSLENELSDYPDQPVTSHDNILQCQVKADGEIISSAFQEEEIFSDNKQERNVNV